MLAGMKLFTLVKKATRVLLTRPFQFWMNFRGFSLFWLSSKLSKVFMGKSSGISLGKNVRIQKLGCLSAERPNSEIELGDHSVVYEHAQIASYGNGKVLIGERNVIGDVRIYARERVKIGDRCVFSWNVFIQDFHPHPVDPELRRQQMVALTDSFLPSFQKAPTSNSTFSWKFPTEPVELGDDLWFGANCTILPGVKIGSGSVVAAGAVVVRGEYPPFSVLAGNPARVVKTLTPNASKGKSE